MKRIFFLIVFIALVVPVCCCLQSTVFASKPHFQVRATDGKQKTEDGRQKAEKDCKLQADKSKIKQHSPNPPASAGLCLQRGTKSQISNRIIAFSPAITEIVFALGAGDDIIAVSDFCNYPPEAKAKPKIGGIINPSYEHILMTKPDLLIFQGQMAKIKSFCEKYKIDSLNVQIDNWASITNSIQKIGNKIGKEKAAEILRENMAARWNKLKNSNFKAKVPTFVCAGRESGPVASCMIPGKKSFIMEALEVAGGSNICSDVIGAYPTVSAEIIFARQPEIIFELRPGEKLNKKSLRKEWNFFKNNKSKVIFITNDFAMVPGPRIVDLAELLKQKINNATNSQINTN